MGKIITVHNSTYLKVAVQWLNQLLCLVDSEVLRNPPECKTRKRESVKN
jgi:hypothetical protein